MVVGTQPGPPVSVPPALNIYSTGAPTFGGSRAPPAPSSSLRTSAAPGFILSVDPTTLSSAAKLTSDPPEWLVSNNTRRNAVRFHHDIPDERQNRPGVVDRAWNLTPAVLNGPGAGANAFMVPARSLYSNPVVSESGRKRHRQSDESRERDFESRERDFQAALQLDIDNANERTARSNQARDARNGVNVVTGRGDWPASTVTPRLTEATSIMGEGSAECQTGVPMSLAFVTSDKTTLYSCSLLHGGTPFDSGLGKP